MAVILGFDVYGTLIDISGMVKILEQHIGKDAAKFSKLWREKQLEYTFRRSAMQNYQPFSVCTRHALEYTCLAFQHELTEETKEELLAAYAHLPAFPEVVESLEQLQKAHFRLFAFSNGQTEAVQHLLKNAGLLHYFEEVISVNEVKSFKPSPAVYGHFLRQTEALSHETWLVSSNPFDVLGAMSAGMQAAWVKRSENVIFDPWGIEPHLIVSQLSDLYSALTSSAT